MISANVINSAILSGSLILAGNGPSQNGRLLRCATPAYGKVWLIPPEFVRLASNHF